MRRVLLVSLLLAACAAPRRDAERQELVVVSDFAWPGHAALDDLGRPTGREIDVLRHIAGAANHVIVWRLTSAERAVIETHPELGYEMAFMAPSLHEALPVILHHHERIDGRGYPEGLVGDQIPLEARVVAVADVWDALTSNRSYRNGWRPSEALAHIEAGVGTHFDSAAVASLRMLATEWGIRPAAHGYAEEAWSAVQTCHDVDRDREVSAV